MAKIAYINPNFTNQYDTDLPISLSAVTSRVCTNARCLQVGGQKSLADSLETAEKVQTNFTFSCRYGNESVMCGVWMQKSMG